MKQHKRAMNGADAKIMQLKLLHLELKEMEANHNNK